MAAQPFECSAGQGQSSPEDYAYSESAPNIWYCFSPSWESQVQESIGGNGSGTTHPHYYASDPLAKLFLPVLMPSCWTGQIPKKERNTSTKGHNNDPIELEAKAAACHLTLLTSLNQQRRSHYAGWGD